MLITCIGGDIANYYGIAQYVTRSDSQCGRGAVGINDLAIGRYILDGLLDRASRAPCQ